MAINTLVTESKKAISRPINAHAAYHAHVYYDEHTLHIAKQVCEAAGELFGLPIGRMHQRAVGPHTMWSCQIAFDREDFDAFIPWLDAHRQGLTVFVHGLSGDDYLDHTEHAYWLGEPVAVNTRLFSPAS